MKTERRGAQIAFFLAPIILVYGAFVYAPVLATFALSGFRYDLLAPARFVGAGNFGALLSDPDILRAFRNTFALTIMLTLLHFVVGFALALAVRGINKSLQGVFRFFFYLPCILTTASVAIVWRYMANYHFGVLNWMLATIDLPAVRWTQSIGGAYTFIGIFSLWKFVGIYFLYFFIGLDAIQPSYYEAAELEGANRVQIFFRVTVPMLTPTIFFVMLTLFVSAAQIFDEPYFLTNGGPQQSTETINLLIYRTAFQQFRLGEASALSILLFLVLLVFSLVQVITSKRWVQYDAE